MQWKTLLIVMPLAALALAGCFGTDAFDPYGEFQETGRTVHLKATVVDFVDHEVYPGFKANLWAFCIEPFDPDDAYSAAAIEYRDPLPTDGKVGSPDGPQKKECGVPAPTIRVTQGDRVIVEFSHSHFHPHTIHWHGQFVPWQSDGGPGVNQDSVEAGDSFTYDFIAKRAGTLWYHCHVDTQLHVMRGLYGAFIVEPQEKDLEPKDIDKEYVFVLGTLTRELVEAVPGRGLHSHPSGCASGFQGCMNPEWDVTPDTWLINGRSYPLTMQDPWSRIDVQEGDRVRLRLINVGESFDTMHPHGHDMHVTHRDGNPLNPAARFWVDTLTIGPGERYDVVIEADNPGPWMFHTHVNSHETNCGRSGGGMHTMLVYEGHDMHGFDAELPAACPYEEPFGLASDGFFHRRARLGAAPPVPQTPPATATVHAFDVQQECSVRTVTTTAALELDDPSLLTATSVTVDILGPEGIQVASVVLDETNGGAATIERSGPALYKATTGSFDSPMAGNYTAEVAGHSLGVDVVLDTVVDYYEQVAQTLEAHLAGLPACPGVEVP